MDWALRSWPRRCSPRRNTRPNIGKDRVTPYINHPLAVAELLARVGKVNDAATLISALLHDTVEDTAATPAEIEERFGATVRSIVLEVTDDKRLPAAERKRLQIERAPRLSRAAKQIKIADKICNALDMTPAQPPDWSIERKLDYLDWAEKVVNGCRGANPDLEQRFDEALKERRAALAGGQPPCP